MSKATPSYALAPSSDQGPMRFLFDGLEVRAVDREGRPWFVGKDVCRVLGHRDVKQALSRLPDVERATVKVPDRIGRDQNTTIISLAGVFRLAMTSRVDGAARFRAWLTDDVLPQIYTRGSYSGPKLETREADLSALVDQVASLAQEVATLRSQVSAPAPVLPPPPLALPAPAPKLATFREWTIKPSKIMSEACPMQAVDRDPPTIFMVPTWFQRFVSGEPEVGQKLSVWVESFPPRPWTDVN